MSARIYGKSSPSRFPIVVLGSSEEPAINLLQFRELQLLASPFECTILKLHYLT